MRLEIGEVWKFAKCGVSSRNFVEGETLLNAGHVLNCGKIDRSAEHNLLAFCVQTSGVKERPHSIKGEIGAGRKILSMTCSCKAGLSEMWKHIVGVLLYVTR